MNHYPHHIGDFNTATRHLSRLERAIYRDMLDMYYDTEAAIDGADFERLSRRLLCVTPDDVAALQFVLDEFFEQQDDGRYVHHRCEREIAAFKAAQVDRGVVKKNENQRQTRSRARRAAMFSALRAIGVVLPYNTRMAQLCRACTERGIALPEGDAPVTPAVTPRAVTCDTPDTAIQNQNQNQTDIPPSSEYRRADDGEVPAVHGRWMTVFDQEFGVVTDPANQQQRLKFVPLARSWIAAGVSVGQMRDAVAKAKAEAKEGIAYLPAYVDRVLASMSVAAAALASARGAAESIAAKEYGDELRVV